MSDERPEFESIGENPTHHDGLTDGDSPTRFEALSEVDPELANEQRAVQLKVGDVVGKRFEILEQLGFGGMGAVYRVKDTELDEERALKVMLPSLLQSDKARQRFLEEIKTLQKLAHHGIVRVHDLGIDEERGFRYFTMELIEGKTLHQVLHEVDGNLPVDQTLDIMNQLCDALAYAHDFTIHRDLKPQNVMVQSDGRIKLLDFGLAKLMSPGRLMKSSMALGTAYYQAPEQSVHLGELDKRADIFSLGVIFYELLTGDIPVGSIKKPSEIAKGVPKRLDSVCMKCLEPKPGGRYEDVVSLREGLNSSSVGIPKILLPVAALLVVAIGAGVWWSSQQSGETPRDSGFSTGTATNTGIADTPPFDPSITAVQVIQAKRLAISSRENADATSANRHTPDAYAKAEEIFNLAEELDTRKDYPEAYAEFNKATEAFGAIERNTKIIVAEIEVLDSAKQDMETAKGDADNVEASSFAKDPYQQAEAAAIDALNQGERMRQTEAYLKSARLYTDAAATATKPYKDEQKRLQKIAVEEEEGRRREELAAQEEAQREDRVEQEKLKEAVMNEEAIQKEVQAREKREKLEREENLAKAGQLFDQGIGLQASKEYSQAIAKYKEAAALGSSKAAFNLAIMYHDSIGVPQDYFEAMKWWEMASELGLPSAMNWIGQMYTHGEGVVRDYTEALTWYRKAAKLGDVYAILNIGYAYVHGRGVAPNHTEAMKWYTNAADRGSTKALFSMGHIYYNGLGVEQNYVEAMKWFRQAAEDGDPYSISNIGTMYEMGYGVTMDYYEAVKWYRKAAELGDGLSMYSIGLLYHYGGHGVKKNRRLAKEWYEKARANGVDRATDALKEF